MKKKIIIYSIAAITGLQFIYGCSDFLDHTPDNRVELDNPEQLSLLLIDGYSQGNYAALAELSTDNILDNNSPDENGVRYNLKANDKIDDEVFAWEDAVSGNQQDTPSSVWENAYHAIAVANNVLESIERFKSEGRGEEVSAQEGEALLIRAYNHFVLVNMFAHAYKNENLSEADPGIPYVTQTENTVMVQYERLSVAEVYKRIEEDLLAGYDKIDDTVYDVPKYHFNKKAAAAFATRFYLYKRQYDKALEWADITFGGKNADPSAYMRDWSTNYSNFDAIVQGYTNANSPNNFMLIATTSWFQRKYTGSSRYACNRDAAKATIYGEGPTWPGSVTGYVIHPCYLGKLYVNGNQEYGLFFPKNGELFEYADKIAGTGFGHIVRCEFTAEETLLCRAEAKLYLGDIDGAVNDMKIWDDSRQNISIKTKFLSLNRQLIESFYTPDQKYGIVKPLHIDEIAPSDQYSVTPTIEPYLQCVLHFRRIETIFDGYRWFDIKRYGIEIEHKIGQSRVETLTKDDPRRALQLPAEVIAAGMTPTIRHKVGGKGDNPRKINASTVVYKTDK